MKNDLERQFLELEEKFANVLEQVPVAIALLSGPELRFEFFNSSYRELTDFRPLEGLTVREAFPELEGLGFYELLEQVYRSGQKHVQKEARIGLQRQGRLEQTFQDFSYSALQAEDGSILGVIVLAHDVSVTVNARAAVENQELWLRSVLDALPVGLVMVEPGSGRYLFSNRMAQTRFGSSMPLDADQADYARILEIRDLQGRRIESDQLPSKRAAGGERLTNHQAVWRTDKGEFYLSINTDLVPASYGHPDTVLVAFSDISENKLIERALRESEAGLAVALGVSRIGFWSYDPSTGKIRVSDQLCEDWGIVQSEFDFRLETALQHIHPHDRAQVEGAIQEAMQRNQPYLVEYRVVHGLSGALVWIEARGQTIHNESGEVIGLVGTSQNVTERKRTEKKLQESVYQLRRLADSMPQIVWTARPDGNLDYTNQRWAEYSGSSDPAAWLDFVHPDDRPAAVESWTRSVISGHLYETEFRLLRHSDQSFRWHLVRAEAVRERGEITAWYGTCTDLHEQRKLTEELHEARRLAERASQTKSAFLANMSHEIRTPLAAILGYTEILKDETLEPQERLEFLDVISRNGSALTRLIDDILDLSKVEAGQIEPEWVDFDLPQLLSEVRSLFDEQARAKGLRFQLRYAGELPAQVCSDPTRIRQILNNLIGNALKFTAQGEVSVTVEFCDPLLQFEIRDSGIGLNEEQAARLFSPFSQGDNSTTRRFGGTGLGLALSRRLARALGGEVWLDPDRSGPGCTFRASVEVRSAVAEAVQSGVAPAPRLDGLRVLLVEDLADNQRLITHYLERAGAQLALAQDGQEGLEMALGGDFQVVLMDMQMPKLDGYTATRMLRQQGYRKPVVALTAHAMLEERQKILEAGCDAHLTKPLNFELLVATLHRLGF